MAETLTTTNTIKRVKSINFSHFRGFKKQEDKFNTDADIVLLTGPNGYGKSSFLEGLLLVLTGWYKYGLTEDREAIKQLISLPAKGTSPADYFKIEADIGYETNNGNPGKISIQWHNSDSEGLKRPKGLPDSRLSNDSELEARLCGFFQDRVEMLFDQGSRGVTMRDVIKPLSERLKDAILFFTNDFPKKIEIKKEKFTELWPGKGPEMLSADLTKAWNSFLDLFAEFSEKSGKKSENYSNIEDVTNIKIFAVKILEANNIPVDIFDSNLLGKLEETLTSEIQGLISKSQQEGKWDGNDSKRLKDEIKEIDKKIDEINTNYPDIKNRLTLFKAKDPEDPDMEAVFRSLLYNAGNWSSIDPTRFFGLKEKPENKDRLKRVLNEFAAVLPEEAGKCLHEINEFLNPLKAEEQKLNELEKTKKELEQELLNIRMSYEVQGLIRLNNNLVSTIRKDLRPALNAKEEWNFWNEAQEHRIKAVAFLEAVEKIVEETLKFLNDITAPPEDIMKEIADIVNLVMRRFSMVDDFLPVSVDVFFDEKSKRNICLIKTSDDRELAHFSTGQRAQAAVAFLTAQNLAVSHMLTHRIIILDDVTTSYDLSNLTREALLWRQLAYGMEGQKARQIFISSHHEDLTNHLLDLLVPPDGHRMKLLKFEGWTPENGPEIEPYDVTETLSIKKNGVLNAFANSLKDLKC